MCSFGKVGIYVVEVTRAQSGVSRQHLLANSSRGVIKASHFNSACRHECKNMTINGITNVFVYNTQSNF